MNAKNDVLVESVQRLEAYFCSENRVYVVAALLA